MSRILEVKRIEKSFGEKKVLDDVNLHVEVGECLGIVGRSGCGKSTLVRIISRFINPDRGQIIFDGEDLTHKKNLRAVYSKMQMIFQMPEDSFDPRRTLGWSIGEPLKNHKFDNIDGRVNNLLTEVGLPAEYAKRYPHEVSGGECQKAAIARAIALSPKLLICDEATSALDVNVQSQVIKLLRKLCTEKNIACLFITHDLALLPQIANRVIVMHSGKIVEEGKPDDVINKPKSEFTKELVSADLFNF